MQVFYISLIILLIISQCQCEDFSCRTNCSKNATSDDQCWHDALAYRSSQLLERILSFSSLSVYVDSFQRHHVDELNSSINFIEQSLDNQLRNESISAKINLTVFTHTKRTLLHFCRNLTSKPTNSTMEMPPLACSLSSCSSDMLNYMVLFMISIITLSLILILFIIQLVQTHRKRILVPNLGQNTALLTNSLSTTNTSVNA